MAAIGIDLGTASSRVALWNKTAQKAEVIPNDNRQHATPSWVYYCNDVCIVGDKAKMLSTTYPDNIIFDTKRMLGRKGAGSLNDDRTNPWPFKVAIANRTPTIEVPYKGGHTEYTPEEVSAIIIARMKYIAETHRGGNTIQAAVVTVPAHFDDEQRSATVDACRIAGLKEVRLLDDDTAAALAYGMKPEKASKKRKRNPIISVKNVLVFNLGSESCSAKIITIKGASSGLLKGTFRVRGKAEDANFGGNHLTRSLVEKVVQRFCEMYYEIRSTRIWNSYEVVRRIRDSCERTIRELCNETPLRNLPSKETIKVVVNPLIDHKEFHTSFKRADFDREIENIYQRCLPVVENCLSTADMEIDDIDHALLVGGSTRIPKLQKMFSDFFRGKMIISNSEFDLNEAAACGAAILAEAKFGPSRGESGSKLKVHDDTPDGFLTRTEISILHTRVDRFMSASEDQVNKVETKGELDVSTQVIKQVIDDPNIREKLRKEGYKEDPTQALIKVGRAVRETRQWSRENTLNKQVKASDYSKMMSNLIKSLRKNIPHLLRILKVASDVAGVVLTVVSIVA